jgi:hypothetical protein
LTAHTARRTSGFGGDCRHVLATVFTPHPDSPSVTR